MTARPRLLGRLLPGSVRGQLILGVALVHLVMMSVFVADLVTRQRRFLRDESLALAEALASTLAVNSSSWILANDVVGLGEVVQSVRRYPAVRYAMVLAPDGRVLAHTDEKVRGRVVSDASSLSLLRGAPTARTVAEQGGLLDVAAPVLSSGGVHVGWARVGLGQERIAASLSLVSRNGVLYTLLAISLGSLLAALIGSRLTAGLHHLLEVAGQVRDGRRDVRSRAGGASEVVALGAGLNEMLDAIAAGEERVGLLLESTMEGILGLDLEGRCVFCNAAALALLGHPSPSGLLQRPLHELVHHHRANGDVYPRSECPACGVLSKADEVHRDDELFWRADGSGFFVEYRSRPMFQAGKRVGAVLTFSDVSDRHRIWSVRAHLASIIESSHDAILSKDLDGTIVSWNQGAERIYGYPAAEILGQSASVLAPPGRQDEVPELIAKVKEGAQVERLSTERVARDGRRIQVELTLSPIRDAGGRIVGISTIARDVTEQKRAAEALRQSEELHRSVVAALSEGILLLGADGTIVAANAAAEEILGPALGGLTGTRICDLDLVMVHEDGSVVGEGDSPAMATLGTGVPSRGVILGIRQPEGSPRWISVNSQPLAGLAGTPYAAVTSFSDVTARKLGEDRIRQLNESLERRVRERTEELEAANRELEAFSYSVSHDLRAPLRAIGGFSAILAQDHAGELDAEARRLLGIVRKNAERMSTLIDDLLTFSRTIRCEFHRSRLEMNQLCRAAIAEVAADSRTPPGVEFRVGELPGSEGDAAMVRQVWLNLLSNAVKFSSRRERPVVEVGATVEDGQAVYFVRDNGAGFDMAYSGKLFGVFSRLHTPAEYEGTGVGLALVKRIVERHGGRAWAEGEVDRGAVFRFTLGARPSGGPVLREAAAVG